MPVIVALAQVDAWLMGTVEEARSLVKPYEGATGVRAVTRRVSDVRAEGPECLDDAEPTWGSQQQLL
jgi:putative SOS response-associated peptidase YedK